MSEENKKADKKSLEELNNGNTKIKDDSENSSQKLT